MIRFHVKNSTLGAVVAGLSLIVAVASSGWVIANPSTRFGVPSLRRIPGGIQRGDPAARGPLLRPRGSVATPLPCQTDVPSTFVGVQAADYSGGTDSAVLGGQNNEACDFASSIGGGQLNRISASGNAYDAFIGAGDTNYVTSFEGFIGAGQSNNVTSPAGFVGAGQDNFATGFQSGVVEGFDNTAADRDSFVGSGILNSAAGAGSFVGAGDFNYSLSSPTPALPGNQANGTDSFVGAGDQNVVDASAAFIGSGANNTISSPASTVRSSAGTIITQAVHTQSSPAATPTPRPEN